MNKFLSVVVLTVASVASVASATPMLNITETAVADGTAYAISLDVGDQNGLFGAFQVDITADTGSQYRGPVSDGFPNGNPLEPGSDVTSWNGQLADPTRFGGLGFAIPSAVVSEDGVSFGGGPLGAFINVDAPFLLANVVLPTGGKGLATIQLIDGGGTAYQTLSAPLGVPEPTSIMLAGLGMIGFIGKRRRS